ncbi:MAG: DNA-binding response regulator [Marinilabiliales bacterium]|nr:MAG: DNA-binding response regulator [Marinilabiliales bacterium]
MDKICIVLVDDHKMFREGIKSVLSEDKNINVCGEAGTYDEAINTISNKNPDIVLTDITLPGKSGIELCKTISEKFPDVKILMLSMHQSEEFVMNSIKNGASGYLPKETGHEELLFAIKKIHQGEIYFNHDISQTIIKGYRKTESEEEPDPRQILSKRELEVLKLYAEGYTNTEIAESLFISVRTVESHKTHILQKLNLKSQVDLIKTAIKHQIIKL